MDEAGWLACADPDPMVRLLWETGSKRKLRLFAVACCQRVLHLVADGRFRASVTSVEDFADGLISTGQLEAITSGCLAAPMPEGGWLNPEFDATWAMKYLPNCSRHDDPPGHILDFFSHIHMAQAGSQATVNGDEWQVAYKAEQKVESDLLRDIFGNPFRPVAIEPEWQTPTVVALAQAAYDNRTLPAGTLETVHLPILADALEDAGCDNPELLGHLRGQGPHVRGCFAVDLILDKK